MQPLTSPNIASSFIVSQVDMPIHRTLLFMGTALEAFFFDHLKDISEFMSLMRTGIGIECALKKVNHKAKTPRCGWMIIIANPTDILGSENLDGVRYAIQEFEVVYMYSLTDYKWYRAPVTMVQYGLIYHPSVGARCRLMQ